MSVEKNPKIRELRRAVRTKLSEDAKAVIAELKKLLTQAEDGHTNGILYIISRSEPEGAEYADGIAGMYERFPTDAVGQLDVVKLKYQRRALDGFNHEQTGTR
jgi:hypothetical protein